MRASMRRLWRALPMGIAYNVRGISKPFIPVDAYVTAHNVYKYLNTIFVVKYSFIYVDIS